MMHGLNSIINHFSIFVHIILFVNLVHSRTRTTFLAKKSLLGNKSGLTGAIKQPLLKPIMARGYGSLSPTMPSNKTSTREVDITKPSTKA